MESKAKIRYFSLIKFKKKRITVQQVALSGIMLSLITVLKLLGIVMPKSPNGSSWVEFYMIFVVILVLTIPFGISLIVLISAPFLWLTIGQTTQKSPFSFFLDYSLPILSFLLIYFAKFIYEKDQDKSKIFTIKKVFMFTLIIFAFITKWFFHTLSGVVAWQFPWGPSAVANAPMVFTTMGATVFVVMLILPKISLIQNFANKNGMKW